MRLSDGYGKTPPPLTWLQGRNFTPVRPYTMTTPSDLNNKLTPGQLFRLGILCEEHDEVMANSRPITDENLSEVTRQMTAVQAPIVRLLYDAGAEVKDFGKVAYDHYHPAFMLSTVAMSPDDFPAGSLGHSILIAAGIRSNDPSTWPVEEDQEEGEETDGEDIE